MRFAPLPRTAATRGAVLDTLIKDLHDLYVFPGVATRLDQDLRARRKRGEFEHITSSQGFADTLTSIPHSVGHDKHFRVGYREQPVPRLDREGPPPPAEQARFKEFGRMQNYGIEQARRLAGNVGYLEVRSFQFGGADAGAAAAAAMQLPYAGPSARRRPCRRSAVPAPRAACSTTRNSVTTSKT